jgi:hypothetical protein
MGERHALIGRGELVDDAQRAHQRLNMVGPRPRGCERFLVSKAAPPPRRTGLAWRFQVISPIQAVIRYAALAPGVGFFAGPSESEKTNKTVR